MRNALNSIFIVSFLVGLFSLPMVALGDPHVEYGLGREGSAQAEDRINPRTIVIKQGDSVSFSINGGVHQVAIYKPGVDVADISLVGQASFPGCAGGNAHYITDGTDREALLSPPPCAAGGANLVQHTFNGDPGTYLLICAFRPHLINRDMFAWVIVQPAP